MVTLADLYQQHLATLSSGYAAALAQAGFDALVIRSGIQRQKHPRDDQDWPFWPEPMFLHWLPLREPGAHLVFVPGKKPCLVRTRHDSYWEGPPPAPDAYVWTGFEVQEVSADQVSSSLPKSGRVAVIGPDDPAPEALITALHTLRSKKTDYERRCIGEANRRGARGHRATFSLFQEQDRSELELNLHYLEATSQDSEDAPYKNIVALNSNAAILHHVHYGRDKSGKEASLLIDAGGTFAGYNSDITRTQVKGKTEAAQRFRTLIEKMEALQQDVITCIRVGMNYEELHDHSHVLLAEVLRQVGVAKGDVSDLVDSGVTRAFFPHGLGHSLGIQVHDVGCKPRPSAPRNPHLRHTGTIEIGQVFTIEPGCYFIDALLAKLRAEKAASLVDWHVVDLLAPLGGIRIEDNVAVEDKSPRNLTRENWD